MSPLRAATPTRQVRWDVPGALVVLMYASVGVALLVFALVVWRLLRI